MNSPGAKDNPTGPFEVVDLDGYAVKPGYSGDIYSSRTMHAIGWVLRHTYPYMIVDTGYEDSDVWPRVAGQFAIREVVKQLEGDWYVRDYWRMDDTVSLLKPRLMCYNISGDENEEIRDNH